MSILQNAINSIQIGIEDYENSDNRRSVSAVRNIAAGILLLYKEKLCELSPEDNKELLIKQHIRPIQNDDGEIVFEGKGHKTVDVHSIKERFKTLNIVVDWTRFDKMNALRNELEHYYSDKSPDTVREIVAKSFLLIRSFLIDHLDIEPQEALGDEAWTTLLEVGEVYLAEEKLCRDSIKTIEWKYPSVEDALTHLRCNNCHSSLIQALDEGDVYPNINLICKSCNSEFSFEDVVEQCIDNSLSGEAYIAIKDGGDAPYGNCHECNQNTFIIEEGCCVACGYKMEYTNCEVCEEPLTIDDQDNEGKCGYCLYKWDKMMAE